MANGITSDDTSWEGMDSNGVLTATRYITIPAGNMKQLDLAESNLIPQIGDAHPENARWTVYSIGGIQHADIPNEYRLAVKYRRVSGGVGITSGGNTDTKPWDLGIVNHRVDWTEVQVPLTELWDDKDKAIKPLVNGAGQAIPCMTDIPVRIDTFQISYNTQKGHKRLAPPGTLNCNVVSDFFGADIIPYAGKILKMTSEDHVVYQNDGKTVKWQYETIGFEVHTFIDGKTTWILEFLNVGNMANFLNPDPDEPYFLGRIYQYTPWNSTDMTVNARIPPRFGCIDDVIMAREAYKEVTGDRTKEIPWSEAEDIPLTASGLVDTEAIQNKTYNKISGYQRQGVDWEPYIPHKMLKDYQRNGK